MRQQAEKHVLDDGVQSRVVFARTEAVDVGIDMNVSAVVRNGENGGDPSIG